MNSETSPAPTFLAKDPQSVVNNCAAVADSTLSQAGGIRATDRAPAAYRLGDVPGFVIQGVVLEDSDLAELFEAGDAASAEHEGKVWVPQQLMIDALHELGLS